MTTRVKGACLHEGLQHSDGCFASGGYQPAQQSNELAEFLCDGTRWAADVSDGWSERTPDDRALGATLEHVR